MLFAEKGRGFETDDNSSEDVSFEANCCTFLAGGLGKRSNDVDKRQEHDVHFSQVFAASVIYLQGTRLVQQFDMSFLHSVI